MICPTTKLEASCKQVGLTAIITKTGKKNKWWRYE